MVEGRLPEIRAAIALLRSSIEEIEADPEKLKLFNNLTTNQAPDLTLAGSQDNGVSGGNDENDSQIQARARVTSRGNDQDNRVNDDDKDSQIQASARATSGGNDQDNGVNDDDKDDFDFQTTHSNDKQKKGAKVHPEAPPPSSSRQIKRDRSTVHEIEQEIVSQIVPSGTPSSSTQLVALSVTSPFAIDTKNTIGQKLFGPKMAQMIFAFFRMTTIQSILMVFLFLGRCVCLKFCQGG